MSPATEPRPIGDPGVVIDHSPAPSQRYVGSPSLAALADGTLVASRDIFGPGSTFDTTRVFRSGDGGRSWKLACEVPGQFWSTLFALDGTLYLMGTSRRFGSVVIRRSTDGAATWTSPGDGRSGLLLADGMYHTAPMPVVAHAGRLWRAMEDMYPELVWGSNFRCFMMSAPLDADLLDARAWRSSNRLAGSPGWLGGRFGGWLEGNAVRGPDGAMLDILRVDYRVGDTEKAALVQVSPDGSEASFDAAAGFVDFPGGCKKFTIRFDEPSGRYWSLSNHVPERWRGHNPERARNTLALVSSADLREWRVERIVLQHPEIERHGFQYVDWLPAGDDLLAVSRTAADDAEGGAHNQHDANFLTFHRVAGFRAGGVR